jgi:hypothetical protein
MFTHFQTEVRQSAELVFLVIKYAHWPVLKKRPNIGLFGKIRHITYSATIGISMGLPVKYFMHVMYVRTDI